MDISVSARSDEAPRLTLRLHYRRLNQADPWESVEMSEDGDQFVATIPASLTDSPYPVQYFVELRDRPDRAWLYPGLNETLSNRPYFVVRQRTV